MPNLWVELYTRAEAKIRKSHARDVGVELTSGEVVCLVNLFDDPKISLLISEKIEKLSGRAAELSRKYDPGSLAAGPEGMIPLWNAMCGEGSDCPECNGMGFFLPSEPQQDTTCDYCRGTGKIIQKS